MECCKKWFFKVKLKIRKYDIFFVLRIQKIIHIQFLMIYIHFYYKFYIHKFTTLESKKKKRIKSGGRKGVKNKWVKDPMTTTDKILKRKRKQSVCQNSTFLYTSPA